MCFLADGLAAALSNVGKCTRHNSLAQSLEFWAGVNQFSDLSFDQFKGQMLMTVEEPDPKYDGAAPPPSDPTRGGRKLMFDTGRELLASANRDW